MTFTAMDLTGQTFGRLTVLRRSHSKDQRTGAPLWGCRCECGVLVERMASRLRAGSARSCGAVSCKDSARRSHGHSRKPAYFVWKAMRQRCSNPNDAAWNRYGGRGIRVCKRWDNSFEAFIADMGWPKPRQSIERIDNARGYEPGNCIWSDDTTQANNKRNNHLVTFGGHTMTVSQWADETGLSMTCIYVRLRRGWSAEKALTTPALTSRYDPRN